MTTIPKHDSFCILPWMHMQLDPSGAVQICCASNYKDRHLVKTGNLNECSPLEIWNNDIYKNLRRDMLQGKKNWPICGSCYERDRIGITLTERRRFNERYNDLGELVQSTKADGSLETLEIRYLDIRFSNLCNLKCRTCGAEYSSSIAAEQRHVRPDDDIVKYNRSWEKILPYLGQLREIYFAGGEPLIMPEHYDFLDSLVQKGQTDMVLLYNTNLTRLGIRGHNVLDYWKRFGHVGVAVSLDHYGKYAGYVRGGSIWQEIVDNVATIRAANLSSVDIGVSTVISLYNILHFGDFVIQLFETGILTNISKLYVQQLVNPEDHQACNLTPDCLDIAIHSLDRCCIYLNARGQDGKVIEEIKDWLLKHNLFDQERWQRFRNYNDYLDKMRGTDFALLYPEYQP